ncbi:MAG: transposase [Acidobacteria bacterium]|nr:transposase [Acidobacteriota bacterium]
MSNHVHLVVVPHKAESLAATLKQTHGRYATYWNALHKSSGHVWQGRFYSCPLDDAHLWIAMRYTERNPVRAKMVTDAAAWNWSSAAVHCGETEAPAWLDLAMWSTRWSSRTWREYLGCGEQEEEIAAIRHFTHNGRPLGAKAFVQSLEQATLRRLTPQKGGRRRNATVESKQSMLSFDN